MDKKLTYQQMMKNLQEGMRFYKKQVEYFENHSIDQLLDDLKKYYICLTETEILEKYKQYFDINEAVSYYFKEYKDQWDNIDCKKEKFSSDIMINIVDKIVKKYFDIEKICDPHYIQIRMNNVDNLLKDQIQDKILGIINSIIEYAKRINVTKLDNLLEDYDINEYLLYYIKKCHNRDMYFKAIMKDFYNTFEDADPRIYRIKK